MDVNHSQVNPVQEATYIAPPVKNLEEALVDLFWNEMEFARLGPEQLKTNTFAMKLFNSKLAQPVPGRITFTATDFTTLIHPNSTYEFNAKVSRATQSQQRKNILIKLQTLARVSLKEAISHRLSGCHHCSYLPQTKTCDIVGAASRVNYNPDPDWIASAIEHVRNCNSCQYKDAYNFLERAVNHRPAFVQHFSVIIAQMAKVACWEWRGDSRFRFVDIVSRLNVYLVELPKEFYLQGSSDILALALAAGKIGRKFGINELIVKVSHDEKERIFIHANRRFRWLYFLFIAVANDGYEYKFVKAFLQYGRGSWDYPACHSILGGLNRKKTNDSLWRFGHDGQTFERYAFFKAMATTVELSDSLNKLDMNMESCLRDRASILLTQVAQGSKQPDVAFANFCDLYEEWAKPSLAIDPTYILAHLDYIKACREDPLHPFRKTDYSDSHFNDVVQAVLQTTKINPAELTTQWEQSKSEWLLEIQKHLLAVDFVVQQDSYNAMPIEIPPFQPTALSNPNLGTSSQLPPYSTDRQ